MIVISRREFRDKQAEYFDRADNGEQIIVQRGKNKAYTLIPVTEDDILISKEYILKPDEDLARAITGEQLLERVREDLREMFKKGKK